MNEEEVKEKEEVLVMEEPMESEEEEGLKEPGEVVAPAEVPKEEPPSSPAVSCMAIEGMEEKGDGFVLSLGEKFTPVEVSMEWMGKYNPKAGGFLVRHQDGSLSYKS